MERISRLHVSKANLVSMKLLITRRTKCTKRVYFGVRTSVAENVTFSTIFIVVVACTKRYQPLHTFQILCKAHCFHYDTTQCYQILYQEVAFCCLRIK
jgi:hypothetical protein